MLIDASRQTYRSTLASGYSATWTKTGTTAAIMFVRRPDSSAQAFRLSKGRQTPTPAVQPGTISFDPESYPDLAQVREWYPSFNELWDAVKAELWDSLLQSTKIESRDHVCGGGGYNGRLHS